MGKRAEAMARLHLEKQGYILLVQNYRSKLGEIDLIMEDNSDIVFVEVRYRRRSDFGSAMESIDQRKKNKIIKTAMFYLQQKNWFYHKNSRFDVVTLQPVNGKLHLDWIKNAFVADL
jgi:putative endonuclease